MEGMGMMPEGRSGSAARGGEADVGMYGGMHGVHYTIAITLTLTLTVTLTLTLNLTLTLITGLGPRQPYATVDSNYGRYSQGEPRPGQLGRYGSALRRGMGMRVGGAGEPSP